MDVTSLAALSTTERAEFVDRGMEIEEVMDDAQEILSSVRADGDTALRTFAAEFDDVDQTSIDISDQVASAYQAVDAELRAAIERAAENVRAFHTEQLPEDWRVMDEGRELGRRFQPLDRVGVYVPGGTAAYPSSAIMGVVPAVVAGVDEVVVTTPPAESLNPATLAAMYVAGADEVYAVGGAQAIAALAYGTETIDPVQKVIGPGNRWVTAAKAAVRGDCAIDFLAGPTEILVIADETATPALVASDLVAQAEHDPHASVVAVCTDRETATAVAAAVDSQLPDRDRESIAREAFENASSGILVADSTAAAAAFADSYAAEHLAIQTANPEAVLAGIDSAGSVFLGHDTPVAAGDYASGTNHILPTGGGARVHGGVSVDTFLRASTVQRLDHQALASLRDTITTLASAEGLEAHAHSVDSRFED